MSNIHYNDEQFRKEVIMYLDGNWDKNIPVSRTAEYFGYTERHFRYKFRNCMGFSYGQYLQKVKLHRVAAMIKKDGTLKGAGSAAGFETSQSFSKAFKKEFGVSPRVFMKEKHEVPDIPAGYRIGGRNIRITYEERGHILTRGLMPQVIGEDIDRKPDFSKCLCHEGTEFKKKDADQIRMWWYDEQNRMYCYVGEIIDESAGVSEEIIGMEVPAGYYAVFSLERFQGESIIPENIQDAAEDLMHFVYDEWKVINCKELKKTGVVYEQYSDSSIIVCIPIYRKSIGSRLEYNENGPASWTEYIDGRITEGITAAELAERFNYTQQHFIDTFSMYYGVHPEEYIRKRRLSLTAKELHEEHGEIQNVSRKYGYSSVSAFRKEYFDDFHHVPEHYNGREYEAENLRQYCQDHKNSIYIRQVNLQDFIMEGKNAAERKPMKHAGNDMIEKICFMLQEEIFRNDESMIVVWKSNFESTCQICLCGPEIKKGDGVSEEEEKNNDERVFIKGGSFVVIESLHDSDSDSLIDTYRMLYRCAFMGWISDHWDMLDLDRLTFVKYENNKLYFHVPVKM